MWQFSSRPFHACYLQTLLREKDVNPLHPWDTSLPLFISDPRYVLLPSVSARREAFDEYCRERARELRASRVKKEKEDPKEEFELLLTTEVKSTRTSWSDFRRQWKKDRRFYGWGRDDREREKRFREFLRELGESTCYSLWCVYLHKLKSFSLGKRALAQKAEADFFILLKESGVAQQGAAWKEVSQLFVCPTTLLTLYTQVKKAISSDPRYDAVGSSSLREELFNTFLTSQSNKTIPNPSDKPAVDTASVEGVDETQKRKDRKAQAVKEREQKIKAERDRVQANIEKSRVDLNKEEGELQFRCAIAICFRLRGLCAGAYESIIFLAGLFLRMRYGKHRYERPSVTGSDLTALLRQHGNHLLSNCSLIHVFDILPCLWDISAICFRHTLANCAQNTWTTCMRSFFPILLHSPRSLPRFLFHPSCPHSLLQNWALMYSNLNKNLTTGSSQERRGHEKRSTICYTKTHSLSSGEG